MPVILKRICLSIYLKQIKAVVEKSHCQNETHLRHGLPTIRMFSGSWKLVANHVWMFHRTK